MLCRHSLYLISNLLFSVVPLPQDEYEEQHHGNQSYDGAQCRRSNHASIGSWKTYHSSLGTDVSHHGVWMRAVLHVQVITSRLMEQLSVPAVLLARQMYFPDMPLVRLLSLRVPCLSSASDHHILILTASLKKSQHSTNISHCATRGRWEGLCTVCLSRSVLAVLLATGVPLETQHQ